MAARKNKVTLDDAWRNKIKATALMNRLMSHVNGELDLSPTQIKAADILLKKIVPDLSRAEHVGDKNAPVALSFSWKK